MNKIKIYLKGTHLKYILKEQIKDILNEHN